MKNDSDRAIARKWRPGFSAVAGVCLLILHSLAPAVARVSQPAKQLVSTPPPIVATSEPPTGTETLAVQWLRILGPNRGAMSAAVARPSGTGPFPAVLILHGTHGFAREYVQWARELADAGFLAVAACWFSGGGGAGTQGMTPIPCPDIPPLGPGAYEEGLPYIDALIQATRALSGARPERLALIGHSRGAGAALQYLLSGGRAGAVVLHSSGYALQPETRAGDFSVPILILHGTADGPGDGGGPNTQVAKARDFEAALKRNHKSVEATYYRGGGHNTFFTNSTQHADEMKTMTAFLRRHLGR